MAGEMVKYHNDLSNLALKNFTAAELDILMALCNRMRNKETSVFTFDFSELRKLTKTTETNNKVFAESIRRTNKKLLELNIMLHDEENPGTTIQFALFKRFKTSEETQSLEIAVNDDFAFILNALSENFTRFELNEFVALKSSYSKACYRQLKRYRDTGWWKVNIDEFRRILDIPNSYTNAEMSRKVLKPIQEELPAYFDKFLVTKIYGKGRGKPVIGIEFEFTPQEDLFPSEERKESVQQEDKIKETGHICPSCGEPLVEKIINGSLCWCHKDGYKKEAKCSKIYNSIAEINGYKEIPKRNDNEAAHDKSFLARLFGR